MQIDWWTLALQTVNLLVLVWLLGRFLFKPIARIVEERQAAVAQALDEAKETRKQAEQAEEEAKSAAAKVAAERNGILEKANEEAEKEKARLVDKAREETNRMVEQAKGEIDRMRDTEAAENGKRASKLAVDIAARLFQRLPDEARVAGFIGGLRDALAALPDRVRSEIGANGAPITVKAARQLSEEETKACNKAIAEALGRDADITVAVDPSLIAGFEIETAHAVARNSFRADLDRIADELTKEEAENG